MRYPTITAEVEEIFGEIGLFAELFTLEGGSNFDTAGSTVFKIKNPRPAVDDLLFTIFLDLDGAGRTDIDASATADTLICLFTKGRHNHTIDAALGKRYGIGTNYFTANPFALTTENTIIVAQFKTGGFEAVFGRQAVELGRRVTAGYEHL